VRAGVKGRHRMQRTIVSATEAGLNLPKLLSLASGKEPTFITDDRGRARAVVMDIDRYHAMMDSIEGREAVEAHNRDAEVAGALLEAVLQRMRKPCRDAEAAKPKTHSAKP
jgi:PHD/YefM family antitoxin component YafN of YafNO toxin-antitoxin module